jgi:hypothetical protein
MADMSLIPGDVVKRSSDAWKQGGLFYRDCVTWSIGRHPAFQQATVSADNATAAS